MDDYVFALQLQESYDREAHQHEQNLEWTQFDDDSDTDRAILAISDRIAFGDTSTTAPTASPSTTTSATQSQYFDQQQHSLKQNNVQRHSTKVHDKLSVVDERWELVDPSPDIRALFIEFDKTFFWHELESVEVKWSPRMTLCAGVCVYEGRGGLCSVRLSEPLLKLRPRKDLVETMLHEMIHAFLFVTQNDRDRDGHGPEFLKHMHRINNLTGAHLSVYHNFHDEVDNYRQHWWKCDGPCQTRKPYFGYVRRAMNRAPSQNDTWWADHQRTCGGRYRKVKEPAGYGDKKGKAAAAAAGEDGDRAKPKQTIGADIRGVFKPIATSQNGTSVTSQNGTSVTSQNGTSVAAAAAAGSSFSTIWSPISAAGPTVRRPSVQFPGSGAAVGGACPKAVVRRLPGIGELPVAPPRRRLPPDGAPVAGPSGTQRGSDDKLFGRETNLLAAAGALRASGGSGPCNGAGGRRATQQGTGRSATRKKKRSVSAGMTGDRRRPVYLTSDSSDSELLLGATAPPAAKTALVRRRITSDSSESEVEGEKALIGDSRWGTAPCPVAMPVTLSDDDETIRPPSPPVADDARAGSPSAYTNCPACGWSVLIASINVHLDTCL